MAIVGEPCNVEAYADNPGLFMTMLCPRLCVRLYCTPVHTDCDCTVVSMTDQSIASIQGTPDTHHTHMPHTSSGSPTKKYILRFPASPLPCRAYRFFLTEAPFPTMSFTPHLGADISFTVSLSSTPVRGSPAKAWNSWT